jgi:hypothetical protein
MSDTLDTKRTDQIGMTHQTVARLDLAKNLSATTLYALEHFRYGSCPGAKAQAMMTGKTPPQIFTVHFVSRRRQLCFRGILRH